MRRFYYGWIPFLLLIYGCVDDNKIDTTNDTLALLLQEQTKLNKNFVEASNRWSGIGSSVVAMMGKLNESVEGRDQQFNRFVEQGAQVQQLAILYMSALPPDQIANSVENLKTIASSLAKFDQFLGEEGPLQSYAELSRLAIPLTRTFAGSGLLYAHLAKAGKLLHPKAHEFIIRQLGEGLANLEPAGEITMTAQDHRKEDIDNIIRELLKEDLEEENIIALARSFEKQFKDANENTGEALDFLKARVGNDFNLNNLQVSLNKLNENLTALERLFSGKAAKENIRDTGSNAWKLLKSLFGQSTDEPG